MPQPTDQLPKSVRDHARYARLGPTAVPALLAHPHQWQRPAPVCLWLHGRSVNKELDPGRYSRWLRAGVGVCAIDLPGHGERATPARHSPEHTIDVINEAIAEIDQIVEALFTPDFEGAFDRERLGIGGMSMGGMVTLSRLCHPHPFRCATVESTAGDLRRLYFPEMFPGENLRVTDEPWPVNHDPARVAEVDTCQNLDGFEPIPMLVLHSETDEMVPWAVQKKFVSRLREHYEARAASPSMIEVTTWPETGAYAEHVGFGRFGIDAKNIQADFLARHLSLSD